MSLMCGVMSLLAGHLFLGLGHYWVEMGMFLSPTRLAAPGAGCFGSGAVSAHPSGTVGMRPTSLGGFRSGTLLLGLEPGDRWARACSRAVLHVPRSRKGDLWVI